MSPYGFGNSIPVGGIIIWYGLSTAVPAGWALCDGTGGTPDLRSRIVRGCAAGNNPGGPFGADTHQHAPTGAHQHASDGDHDHGGAAVGATDLHEHAAWGTAMADDVGGGSQVSVLTSINSEAPPVSCTIGGSGDHAHAGVGDHAHAAATHIPSYHTVHFIMRVW